MKSKKTIGIIIAAAVVLVIAIVVGVAYSISQNTETPSQPTEPSTPVTQNPSIPTQDATPGDNYNLDDRDYGVIMVTKQSSVDFATYNVSTPASPNGEFAIQIDVNDVITFTFGKQSPTVDIKQLYVFAVAHENMQNPYTTPVNEYKNVVFSSNFNQQGEKLTAQAMIGYDTGVNEVLDVLVVYKNEIVGYSMFKVVDRQPLNKAYWENRLPGAKIQEFSIVTPNETIKCFYDANTVTTLLDWTISTTNIYGIIRDITAVTDADKTWMVGGEYTDTPITDGQVFTTVPYVQPNVDFTYDVTNPQYFVYWLGKTKTDVSAIFGAPITMDNRPTGTRLEYESFEFFLVDDVVVQININKSGYTPINGLPSEPCTGMTFADICTVLDIELPYFEEENDFELDFYVVKLPFKQDNWTVEYIWEYDSDFNPDLKAYTRIIVYSGEIPMF